VHWPWQSRSAPWLRWPAAARIGGDLYDVAAMAGTVRLIVADVRGKGLPAVQTAAVDPGLPLGLGQLAPDQRKEHTVPFGPGDRMLFYTDGISEARDKSGAFYPVDRCGALLADPDPDAALDRLYGDVLRHVGGHLNDDSAALFVVYRPP
jgi:serine phosphatase RsbU (regulator of sigma subunit)